jgi:histone arginine demethylase JMJD6
VLAESPALSTRIERSALDFNPGIARVSVTDAVALLPLRVPVIFFDASADWPLRRATPEYFRRVHGAQRVCVAGAECTLAELIDRLERATPGDPGPYPCKFEIARTFRELLPQVAPRFACSLPDRQCNRLIPQRLFARVNNLEIFFGGAGGRFPYLHYDLLHLHAWITQLYGDKEFTLYAPDQEPFLYPDPELPWQSRIRDLHAADFVRYPLLRNAHAQRVVLHAGETLFLPAGWWHTTRNLTFTISVAFDQLGPDNWDAFVGDIDAELRRNGSPRKALALGFYLRALGVLLSTYEFLGGNRSARWGQR